MTEEHPFAQFVRIIGKGPHLSRPLTEDEMLEAARMILAGQVEPLQLGAFLCLLRVRTEVPAEGAGFVRAVRETFALPADKPRVDLDWASYSGKLRQLPWYVLAALLLAQNGVRVFMHGTEGHTAGRVYTRQVFQYLGLPLATSFDEAAAQLRAGNIAYMPLAHLQPRLQEIIELKSILGLRSPVNTFGRMVNAFDAPHEFQTVFHPGYRDVHRDTANLLGQKHMAVFKGEGGEAERRPHKPLLVQSLHEGEYSEEEWPILVHGIDDPKDTAMDLSRLKAVWTGAQTDAYGEGAVIGTAAIALRLMGRGADTDEATDMAREMWAHRNRDQLGAAA
ncbi:MAG: glycosyl transferase family protein [Rhodobacterales bacterium]|nr:glycosyl transferase family protein [Rhodobacterales bacterium]